MAKKKVKKVSTRKIEIRSFEKSLEELEKVVHELENGQLTLSESLARYEEGIRNLKACHQILESAESRIRLLTGVDAHGNPTTETFDEQATQLQDRSSKRSFSTGKATSASPDQASLKEPDAMDDSDSLF
ncbi:MAG: exodeoxyribonuclease VII small subunit [Planctomycetota bacterium]|nr:exodeoxyribonuclease VII small subunit [Planctomycetota bacterium]